MCFIEVHVVKTFQFSSLRNKIGRLHNDVKGGVGWEAHLTITPKEKILLNTSLSAKNCLCLYIVLGGLSAPSVSYVSAMPYISSFITTMPELEKKKLINDFVGFEHVINSSLTISFSYQQVTIRYKMRNAEFKASLQNQRIFSIV